MISEVAVAAVSAAVGAATVPMLQWIRRHLCAEKPKKKAWEPFEPGVCDELPEHDWGFEPQTQDRTSTWAFWCPKCLTNNGINQPPLCHERGGHFHFKCRKCGYEWAMKTADRVKTKDHPRPTPGDGITSEQILQRDSASTKNAKQ